MGQPDPFFAGLNGLWSEKCGSAQSVLRAKLASPSGLAQIATPNL